jgi:YD repeat-containing protein
VAVTAPGFLDTPQREASHVLGLNVYAHSGEFFLDETDLTLPAPGRGLGYRFRRRYESGHRFAGALGHGWEHEYEDRRLHPGVVVDNVVRANGAGHFDEYLYDAARDLYVSPIGVFSRLFVDAQDFFVERDVDGTRYQYHPFDGSSLAGRLLTIEDRNGNSLSFVRGPAGRISQVFDSLGRTVTYGYDAEGRILNVTDFSGRSVTFKYDPLEGDLVAVTGVAVTATPNDNNFPQGKRVEYVYSSGFSDERLNHNLTEVIDPRESPSSKIPRVTVSYGTDSSQPSFDRVETQVWGGTNSTGVPAGGTISFTYDVLRPPLEGAVTASELEGYLLSVVGRTTCTDQEGRVRDLTLSGAGLPLELRVHTVPGSRLRDPSNLHPPPGTVPPFYSTRWSWTREGLLATKVEPRGDRVEYFYDDVAPIRHAQAALVRTEHHPVPTGGAPPEPAVTTFLRDPLFGEVVEEVTPRGNDPAFEPPLGGPGGPARYATQRFLDYQEAVSAATLALEAGVPETDLTDALARVGIALGLGDLNGDGPAAQRSGNVVQVEPPAVTLPDGGVEASSATFLYNAFGQLTERTDESGRTVRFEYHPETDYDGDGVGNGGGDPLQGGFLARRIAVLADDGPGPPDEIIQESYVYEARGFLAKRTDGNGNEEFHVHNQLGQLVELRLPTPIKYRRHFDYDADDNLVRVRIENYKQADGGTQHSVVPANQWLDTDVERDLLGRPVTLTREVSAGEVGPAKSIATLLRYHPGGTLARVVHEVPATDETRTYDERDLVIEHARGAGTGDEALTESFYDENGNLVLTQTASGIREELRYDGFSRLVATIDAVGGARVFERDIEGQVLADSFLGSPGGPTPTTRDGGGNVLLESSSLEYDERGRNFEMQKALFNRGADPLTGQPVAPEALVESRWHDGAGRVVRRLDPEGGEWLREYDGAGRLARVTQPGRGLQLFTYDSNDNVISEVHEQFTLDPVLDPGEFAAAAGDPDYDAEGRLREVTTILRVFDALNRMTLLVDTMGGVWRARYDSSSNLIFTSDATGSSIAPDPEFDSLLAFLTPLQAINLNGHGNRRRFVYNNVGRLVEARHELREGGEGGAPIDLNNGFNFDGVITETFEWDDNNRLHAWVDDTGGRTAVDYDGAGYVAQKTWPDLTVETHTRDRDGNRLGLLDTGSTTFTQTFDSLHRLVERNIARVGVEGTTRQRFEYDGLSGLTLAFDDNGPGDPADDSLVLFRRDSAGNVVEEIQDGFVVLSAYDRGSRPVSRRYADGRGVSTLRDTAGRITSLEDATSVYATYRHFGSGALLDKLLSPGLELSFLRDGIGGLPRKAAYDVGGGIREQVYRDGTGAIFRGFEYGRDRNGFRLYERPLHGVDSSGDVWRYDSVYRIQTYLPDVFDPRVPPINPLEKLEFFTDGNHSWRFIVVDQGFRELEVNARSAYECSECGELREVLFTYDGRGNLTAAGNTSFIYDALGRIVRVERNELIVGTYLYDAVGTEDPEAFVGRGRRVSKNVLRPSSGQPAGFTRFIFVGNRMAEERDENDSLLRQYLYEEDGRPAVLLIPSGASGTEAHTFLHDDAGSISALVSSSGQLEETMTYGPFGESQIRNPFEAAITFSSFDNTLGFGGLPHDFELGLHMVGGRHFDPNLGRFLSEASDLFPSALLQLNGYLSPGLPGLPGEVVGEGSAARRASYLDPFRVEILTPEDSTGAAEKDRWRETMDLKAVLEGRR